VELDLRADRLEVVVVRRLLGQGRHLLQARQPDELQAEHDEERRQDGEETDPERVCLEKCRELCHRRLYGCHQYTPPAGPRASLGSLFTTVDILDNLLPS